MPLKTTLIYNDETGQVQRISVSGPRFTIGRDAENDLALEFSDLSSRHAQLECQGDRVRLYDCNSQTGTWLNQRQVTTSAILSNGDVIRLGPHLTMTVRIEPTGNQALPSSVVQAPPPSPLTHRARFLNIPVVAGVSGALVLLLVGLFAIPMLWGSNRVVPNPPRRSPTPDLTIKPITDSPTEPTPEDCTDRAGVQMMKAIASDRQVDFTFRETRNIDELRKFIAPYLDSEASKAGLAETFRQVSQDRAHWVAEAKATNVEPMLLFGVAMALTDGGQKGNLLQQATSLRDKLPAIVTLLGKNLPDDALLVIAGVGMGYGSSRWQSFARQRTEVQDANAQRNVWYYHKKNILDQAAYQFALRALALGAIALQPRCFGVDAEPLSFNENTSLTARPANEIVDNPQFLHNNPLASWLGDKSHHRKLVQGTLGRIQRVRHLKNGKVFASGAATAMLPAIKVVFLSFSVIEMVPVFTG